MKIKRHIEIFLKYKPNISVHVHLYLHISSDPICCCTGECRGRVNCVIGVGTVVLYWRVQRESKLCDWCGYGSTVLESAEGE